MRQCGTASAYRNGCRCNWCRDCERDRKRVHRGSPLADLTRTISPIGPQPWRTQAACAGHPVDLFYPDEHRGNLQSRHARQHALNICRSCPVTTQCLAHALDIPELDGIWGATTPQDRDALRRLRGRGEATA